MSLSTDLIRHAIKVQQDSSISRLMQKTCSFAYKAIYPRAGVLNTVLNPYHVLSGIGYEYQYLSAIKQHVVGEQTVVLVGGGDGVSAVAAARQVQPNGTGRVFEGGNEEVEKINRMVELNLLENTVSVSHTIVSNSFSLRSSSTGADVLPPAELPECDTLAIDADGAEIPILESMEIRPETLIVEHHLVPKNMRNPDKADLEVEFQPDTVRHLVQDMGYEIITEKSDPTQAYGRFRELVFVAEKT